MTSLQRRLRKLEAHVAVQEVVVPEWVAVMRERRRRRAEAEGRTYMEPTREPLVVENPNDWAEVMRACRGRRAAEVQRAEANP
jgi:hypothetical protein